jgi:hypothetical protein
VSVDQLESSIPGFIGQMTGKLTNQRIIASTIFVDHESDLSYVYHQTSMTSEETLNSFCGVGAHHQNDIAEKRIGDLQRRATKLLLHAQRRWPDAINSHLWTYAIRAANDSRNYAQTNEDDTCPISKFCNTASVPKVQNQHHFGCPTYVLRKELQDHKKIKKWSDRTRKGINLGYSSRHAHSVSLILNLQTGLVSPQFHCQYDDLFETTMGTQARSIPTSQWQFKEGFTSDRPETDEDEEPNEETWEDQSFEEYYSTHESEETSHDVIAISSVYYSRDIGVKSLALFC